MTTQGAMTPCGHCGMLCTPTEYHPYAACLMFKACHNSETVRANLDAVRAPQPLTNEQVNRAVNAWFGKPTPPGAGYGYRMRRAIEAALGIKP